MMYQGWKAQAAERSGRMQTKRLSLNSKGGGWLDSMLGSGSSKTVERAFAPRPSASPRSTLRMQAVGSNDAPAASAKGNGVIRIGSGALVLLWILMQAKPWQHVPDLKALFEVQAKAAPMHLAAVPTPQPAQEAATPVVAQAAAPAPLQGPILDAKGQPVGLWRAAGGQWYFVNVAGELAKASDADAGARIDLPLFAGIPLKEIADGSKRFLALDLPEGFLSQLVPLSSEIAPEIQSIWVQGGQLHLRTQHGTDAILGSDDFSKKEMRLAAVLADLSARKKRALSVDLRFKDSAVVKLASR